MPPSIGRRFLSLHNQTEPLLLGNAWDLGSAKILESLGFQAIATTSSGFAATLGKLDGDLGREENLRHAEALAKAVSVPVSADLENGYADDPEGVAETVRLAIEVGLAGCSIEDYSGQDEGAIYDIDLAVERIVIASQVAHSGASGFVLTARAENLLHGRDDLADTVERLRRYGEAGADVVYAPGLTTIEDIEKVVQSVSCPVNVLVLPDGPDVPALAQAGVKRISVGGAFAFAGYGALVESARQLLKGSTQFLQLSRMGASSFRSAVA